MKKISINDKLWKSHIAKYGSDLFSIIHDTDGFNHTQSIIEYIWLNNKYTRRLLVYTGSTI